MVSVVAVFGLSGVGKSWLISRFAAAETVVHAQASQLLREARAAISGRAETQEELRKGAVLENQTLLIEAFARLRASATAPVIFDGHSVVDGRDRLIEIPVDVIQALGPTGLVFIRDDPAAIVTRRAQDKFRIRPARTEAEIGVQQDRAFMVCARYRDRKRRGDTTLRRAGSL